MKTTSQKKKKRGNKKNNRDRQSQKMPVNQVENSVSGQKKAEIKAVPVAPKKFVEKKKPEKNVLLKAADIVVHFLRDAKLELKKVKWPTKKELIASTVMVLFLVLAIAFFLGLIDTGLMRVIKLIVG